MYYPNLAAEMARAGVSRRDIAQFLGVKQSASSALFLGKTNLSVSRAKEIRDHFFPGLALDYLFDTAES